MFAIALWFLVFLAGALAMAAAQRRYIALLNQKHNTGLLSPAPTDADYAPTAKGVWRLWTVVWQEQDDRELERARRSVVRRWWIMVGTMVGGFLILDLAPVLLAVITHLKTGQVS